MKKAKIEPQKFSEYFGLNVTQDNLEFLDIYANQDIPLFLDPYGISTISSSWSKECEAQIATYFQHLVNSIKNSDKKSVERLLNALHEVDEVALGYSSGTPSGRGIGPQQAKQIREAFENSQAVQSGDIKDIADCALLIPGINRDKVSDITANILKKQLIDYTQKQCKRYKIPMRKVAVNNVYNFTKFDFESYYAELPVIDNKAKILLPLTSVRHDPELSKDKYYRNFVLEFLRAEHTHPADSLAYVLKNGSIKVNIADLKERYPMSVKFIYEFSKSHPQILEKYKAELKLTASKKGTKPELKQPLKVLSADERIRLLISLKPGNEEASNFHKISFLSLIYIFGGRLSNPIREKEINEGRKRIDIVFDNSDKIGFFNELNTLYHIQCPKILAECKNYGREIGNPEIDQLQGRLNSRRGLFGILLCRNIQDKKKMIQRCKDVMHDSGSYIIVLDDSDVSVLINLKADGNEIGIDDLMTKKLNSLIM